MESQMVVLSPEPSVEISNVPHGERWLTTNLNWCFARVSAINFVDAQALFVAQGPFERHARIHGVVSKKFH